MGQLRLELQDQEDMHRVAEGRMGSGEVMVDMVGMQGTDTEGEEEGDSLMKTTMSVEIECRRGSGEEESSCQTQAGEGEPTEGLAGGEEGIERGASRRAGLNIRQFISIEAER